MSSSEFGVKPMCSCLIVLNTLYIHPLFILLSLHSIPFLISQCWKRHFLCFSSISFNVKYQQPMGASHIPDQMWACHWPKRAVTHCTFFSTKIQSRWCLKLLGRYLMAILKLYYIWKVLSFYTDHALDLVFLGFPSAAPLSIPGTMMMKMMKTMTGCNTHCAVTQFHWQLRRWK